MANSLTPMRRLLEPLDDDFDRMYRRLGRMLDRDIGPFELRSDVREEDGRYVVDVDLPGVRKNDIDVSVSGGSVTVQAEFAKRESDGGKRLQEERLTGECFRSFTFPDDIDAAHATASFEHGVLTLSLPKADGARAKHLRVS